MVQKEWTYSIIYNIAFNYVSFACSSGKTKPSVSLIHQSHCIIKENCEVCCSIYIRCCTTASLTFKPGLISVGVILNHESNTVMQHVWSKSTFLGTRFRFLELTFKHADVHHIIVCQKCDITAYSVSVFNVVLNIFTEYICSVTILKKAFTNCYQIKSILN